MTENVHADIKEQLSQAKRIVLLGGISTDWDGLCSLLAFYHLLRGRGVETRLVMIGHRPPETDKLPGAIHLARELGPQRLEVVFDTENLGVEKIDYFLVGQKLHLIVYPGQGSYRKSQVASHLRGDDLDLMVAFKISTLDDFGPLKEDIRRRLEEKPLVNLDIRAENQKYGRYNLIESGTESLCAVIMQRIEDWGLTWNREAADCLLAGLRPSPASLKTEVPAEKNITAIIENEPLPSENSLPTVPRIYPSPLTD